MTVKGAVSTGHPVTTAAAEEILRDGGNAFDAIIAAHFTACVVEPVLTSLGGGGYLLAEPAQGKSRVYDFFAQTPMNSRINSSFDGCFNHELVEDLDFYPISADFGTTRQEFHIGLGAMATPGVVKGMFLIHHQLGSLPMQRLIEPAVRAARLGVRVNGMQAYIFDIVSPIYLATPEARAIYASRIDPAHTLQENELLVQPDLASTLEALAIEGDDLFYAGEIAQSIVSQCDLRGLLSMADFLNYRVEIRDPLKVKYRDAELLINPPPSSGGILIAFALALLNRLEVEPPHSEKWIGKVAEVMAMTNKARVDTLDGRDTLSHLLDNNILSEYSKQVLARPFCSRGTTHLSVVDGSGNLAAMTVSNGEGCGELADNTGVMLNNILGEEDLNPRGFFRWQPNTRMTSMMAPAILHTPRGRAVLGSGGSNRLRTAILQVVLNLVDHGMSIEDAVMASRIHMEDGLLHLEPDACCGSEALLRQEFPTRKQWPERNLFFGGVHSVWLEGADFHAIGDRRRGGCGLVVS